MSYKFALGQICVTRGVNDLMAVDTSFSLFVWESLKRHAKGDWGNLCNEDKKENDISRDIHLRLLSAYELNEIKIWIVTEADRSVTTVLFPSEY